MTRSGADAPSAPDPAPDRTGELWSLHSWCFAPKQRPTRASASVQGPPHITIQYTRNNNDVNERIRRC